MNINEIFSGQLWRHTDPIDPLDLAVKIAVGLREFHKKLCFQQELWLRELDRNVVDRQRIHYSWLVGMRHYAYFTASLPFETAADHALRFLADHTTLGMTLATWQVIIRNFHCPITAHKNRMPWLNSLVESRRTEILHWKEKEYDVLVKLVRGGADKAS